MLKKTYLFCLVVFYYSFAFAQKERVENLPNFDKPKIHYGFYLGLNQNDFKISYNRTSTVPFPDIEVESSVGFNVGLIADLRLHNNVNLRLEPGLISNTKTLRFNHIANENQATRGWKHLFTCSTNF